MVPTKIYLLLAVVYLFLGFISVTKWSFKDYALKAFLLLTVALPMTKFTTEYHTIFQVSIYYYFFVGALIIYLINILNGKKFHKSFYQITSVLSLMLAFYLIHFFFIVDDNRKLTDVLKDIKPFILIPLGIVFIDFYKVRLLNILTRDFVNKLLFINLILSGIFFFLMTKYDIHLKLTEDPYYKYEELRYETLGSYLGIFYLTFLLYNDKKPSFKELIYCFAPLLFTGNRTLIFSVFLIISLYYLTKLTLNRIILFFSSSLIVFTGFIYLVLKASESSPLFRFQKLLSLEYIEYALLNRFSPFVDTFKTFSGMEYVFGKGLGYAFYIPWFHFREDIDDYNIYIDNLYLTLYTKFGIFFLVIFLLTFFYLKAFNNLKTAIFYFIFILILSITNAFFYQTNFLWIFILFAFPFNILPKRT